MISAIEPRKMEIPRNPVNKNLSRSNLIGLRLEYSEAIAELRKEFKKELDKYLDALRKKSALQRKINDAMDRLVEVFELLNKR